jgi:hypothetical protein
MDYYVLLSHEQNKSARELLDDVKNGSVTSPQDIVSWETPNNDINIGEAYTKEKVDSSQIIGPYSQSNHDRFEPDRLESILEKLVNEEWVFESDFPPCLIETDDGYYVFKDGIHRSIVHKYLDLGMFSELYKNNT